MMLFGIGKTSFWGKGKFCVFQRFKVHTKIFYKSCQLVVIISLWREKKEEKERKEKKTSKKTLRTPPSWSFCAKNFCKNTIRQRENDAIEQFNDAVFFNIYRELSNDKKGYYKIRQTTRN